MYNNTYDLQTIMTGSIIMGAFVFWLFSKFAKRDSDYWDKSYESKSAKINRIVYMCIWGLYVATFFLELIIGWNSIRDNQKVSFASCIMLGISLFYYELTLRQSPRGVWVKTRKVIAYFIISSLYIGVWPTTLLQLTTGKIPGVYGDAWGAIFGSNALIYGIAILIIWLLLKHYNNDKLISYNQKNTKKAQPVIETPSNNSELSEENAVANQEATIFEHDILTPEEKHVKSTNNDQTTIDTTQIPNNENPTKLPPQNTKYDRAKNNYVGKPLKVLFGTLFEKVKFGFLAIIRYIKRIWKWIVGVIILAALIIGGVALYNYLHDEYLPKKKLDRAVNEIIQKFTAENTKVEYAHYILQKNHDWGYDDVFYDDWSGNQYIDNCLSNYREDAYKLIENLAYQGDAKCQFDLGNMYYYGDQYTLFKGNSYTEIRAGLEYEIKCDKEKAAYWWLESAQNGYIRAFNNIGVCYKNGIGVSIDMNKAIGWLKLGAEAGEPRAQKNYGDLFLDGVKVCVGHHFERRPYYDHTGYNVLWYEKVEVPDYKTLIPVDIEQAKYWWKKSAAQGNQVAKERLQKIYE